MGYKKQPCKMCGKLIQMTYNRKEFNHSGLCRSCLNKQRDAERIEYWKNTGDTGYSIDTTIRGAIRRYIYDKQNGCCAICGASDLWNGKELHFILDHINGDASDSSENNLRLICPNCDSQLTTYKSRNRNSARNKRKQYLKDNYYANEQNYH